jgi:hypothetical protein
LGARRIDKVQPHLAEANQIRGDRMIVSFELKALAAASLWGFIQLVAAAQAANFQYGLKWAASPRDDEMPPLKPIPGRIARNFRNYMETFPFFVAATVVVELGGAHGLRSISPEVETPDRSHGLYALTESEREWLRDQGVIWPP